VPRTAIDVPSSNSSRIRDVRELGGDVAGREKPCAQSVFGTALLGIREEETADVDGGEKQRVGGDVEVCCGTAGTAESLLLELCIVASFALLPAPIRRDSRLIPHPEERLWAG
jgi:hypothetical protein